MGIPVHVTVRMCVYMTSPIPLFAAFRTVSADSASKSGPDAVSEAASHELPKSRFGRADDCDEKKAGPQSALHMVVQLLCHSLSQLQTHYLVLSRPAYLLSTHLISTQLLTPLPDQLGQAQYHA